ncbi:kinase-like domain-containing protein [Pavlovales sp. CCMP2436]|nr:kinase-like domain-containing protein [Pavlovales sp. CCMP2436]
MRSFLSPAGKGAAPAPRPAIGVAARLARAQPRTQLVGELSELFEVGAELGKGATSTVIAAVERASGRRVALKVSNTLALAADVKELEALSEEVGVMAALPPHPAIAHLHSVAVGDVQTALVLDLVDGDLFDSLERGCRFPETSARVIFTQLLGALAHCHQNGVSHRDVKPENCCFASRAAAAAAAGEAVDVGGELRVKLVDFGLADFCEGSADVLTGLAGTAGYTAPEVLAWYWEDLDRIGEADTKPGSKPAGLQPAAYGRSCDVWSAGILLHALLTGELPFSQNLPMDKLLQQLSHAQATLDPAAPAWAHISEEAMEVVRRALAPLPADRPTVVELARLDWLHAEASAEGARVAGHLAEEAADSTARETAAGAVACEMRIDALSGVVRVALRAGLRATAATETQPSAAVRGVSTHSRTTTHTQPHTHNHTLTLTKNSHTCNTNTQSHADMRTRAHTLAHSP